MPSEDGVRSRAPDHGDALERRLIRVADVAASGFAVLVVLRLFNQPHVAVGALIGAGLLFALFAAAGIYAQADLRIAHSTLDEVPRLVQLIALCALGVAVIQKLLLHDALHADQIGILWLACFTAVLFARVIVRSLTTRTLPGERCLVIGETERIDWIRVKLASIRARASVVASLPLADDDTSESDWSVLASAIRRVAVDLNVHRIIIAPSGREGSGIVHLIRIAKAAGVRVSVLPRMFEVVGCGVALDDVEGMTLLGVRRLGVARSALVLKRTFDILAGLLAVMLFGPLIITLAIAIRVDSRGPIFFRQVRVGRDGRRFRIVKFRSMVVDAEAQKESLRAFNEAGDGLFKIGNDPRVTRVGRFMRRTSLDELPQLINVVRGEMSLVGPRPLVLDEDAQVVGLDRGRLHLTPGMTGPWQVMGRRAPMEEMVAMDYLYVTNWSLWLDVKLLMKTIVHVARRGNR